ncbi:MAG TPA: FAD-dependent oxidoreductase [Deltaproteobacteria bacterium]|nr:FAD-dependent oxidoreductase [Deltaproteobacteria bacterium]
MTNELPESARIVIIGGGIVGASIAYHLAARGEREVLLLERDRATSGTTWHAAGLVAQLRATENLTRLSRYSLSLYQRLERETGQATGFRAPGAISLATTDERFTELRRTASMARHLGVDAHVILPSEIRALWPAVETDDVVGAIHLPDDAMVSPVDVTNALLAGAREAGVGIRSRAPVSGLLVRKGRVAGVRCDAEEIRAEIVVLAAGMWSRQLVAEHGITIPLHAAEHYYAITEAIDDLPETTPILRDPDRNAYFKEDARRLLVGLFERVARPWPPGPLPTRIPDASFIEIEADLDHVSPLLDRAFDRLPALREVPLRQIFCGPESFTPDDQFLLGETPEVAGLFVAAGFNSIGIQAAGGVGWVLADWILDGAPPMDLWEVDIRRFEPFAGREDYLRRRTVETLGLLYEIHWPFRQPETARNVRQSPLHDRLARRGACFGVLAGWERPLWFARPGEAPVEEPTFGRSNAFEPIGEEHRATREAIGLYDQSSYAEFLLEGPDALEVIDRVSANRMDVEPGRVVYTQWLNSRGGIEADLTVTRLDQDRFWIVTAPATRRRDHHHLARAIGSARARLVDESDDWAALGLMGPRSRSLLEEVAGERLPDEDFPFSTARDLSIGGMAVRALRLTYVGELGWELHVAVGDAGDLFDVLLRAGARWGIRPCGFRAMQSCRIEKGYRHWGHDIGPDDDPLVAGLAFAVAWDKSADFVGRAAVEEARQRPLERRLLHFAIDDEAAMLHGEEPIYRNGERMGLITSGAWGYSLGAAIGLGYARRTGGGLDADWIREGTWEIEIAGRRFPARASLRAFHDPGTKRPRS